MQKRDKTTIERFRRVSQNRLRNHHIMSATQQKHDEGTPVFIPLQKGVATATPYIHDSTFHHALFAVADAADRERIAVIISFV